MYIQTTEDNLVEQKVIEKLVSLGYVYKTLDEIYNSGEFSEGDDGSVILEKTFKNSIKSINKNLADREIEDLLKKVKDLGSVQDFSKALVNNKKIYKYIEEGIKIEKLDGQVEKVNLIDLKNPEKNNFTIINQFSIKNITDDHFSRPDLILFINGIPFVLFEFKNPTNEFATLTSALDGNIKRYKKKIPKLFSYNHLVILSDWNKARYGTLTSEKEHFTGWYAVEDESEDNPRNTDEMETMILGLFNKNRLIDTLRFFTLYDTKGSEDVKIACRYHQYYTVNKTVEKIKETIGDSTEDRVGTIWHTQGSGKTISLAFIIKKCREVLDSPSFVLLTDRRELDRQITKQFNSAKIGIVEHIDSIQKLKDVLQTVSQNKIISTTIQKFRDMEGVINNSGNIIVIADEAHRSQYRELAAKMRGALPNASFLGVTGTPISFNTKDTNNTFGENISEYTVLKAEKDEVIVPIYYDFAAPYIGIKEHEIGGIDVLKDSSGDLEDIEDVIEEDVNLNDLLSSKDRLDIITDNVVKRLKDTPNEQKAMFVANSRKIALNVANLLKRKLKDGEVELVLSDYDNLGEEYKGNKNTLQLSEAFKKEDTNIRILVVCNMLLTGYDVPQLYTLFLDKKLEGHNLIQAITRVNRIYKDKEAGLIIDYIGIVSKLNHAISIYAKKSNKETFKIPEMSLVLSQMNENLDKLKEYIKVDIDNTKDLSNEEQRDMTYKAIENVITNPDTNVISEKRKLNFLKTLSIFERLYLLTLPRDSAYSIRSQYKFLIAIGSAIRKMSQEDLLPNERKELNIDEYIYIKDIISLFDHKDLSINIFDSDVIKKLGEGGFRNLAIEVLQKILEKNIKVLLNRDELKKRSFIEKLEFLLEQYKEGVLSTKEVLEKLKVISEEIIKDNKKGNNNLGEKELIILTALERGVELDRESIETENIIKHILKSLEEKNLLFRGWVNNDIIKAKIKTIVIEILGNKFNNLEYEKLKETGALVLDQLVFYEKSSI